MTVVWSMVVAGKKSEWIQGIFGGGIARTIWWLNIGKWGRERIIGDCVSCFSEVRVRARERLCKESMSEMGKMEEEQILRPGNWVWMGVKSNQKFTFEFFFSYLKISRHPKGGVQEAVCMPRWSSEKKAGLGTWIWKSSVWRWYLDSQQWNRSYDRGYRGETEEIIILWYIQTCNC